MKKAVGEDALLCVIRRRLIGGVRLPFAPRIRSNGAKLMSLGFRPWTPRMVVPSFRLPSSLVVHVRRKRFRLCLIFVRIRIGTVKEYRFRRRNHRVHVADVSTNPDSVIILNSLKSNKSKHKRTTEPTDRFSSPLEILKFKVGQ